MLVYNYQGYGTSIGSTSPNHLREDGEAIYRYLRDTLKVRGKIGVYGRSMGGMVACHIARKCHIDLLIADRTFANFDYLAKKKFLGSFIVYLMKAFSFNWFAHNDISFVQSRCGFKIQTIDPDDDIIEYGGSLLSWVAFRAIQREDPAKILEFKDYWHILTREETHEFLRDAKQLLKIGELFLRHYGDMYKETKEVGSPGREQVSSPAADEEGEPLTEFEKCERNRKKKYLALQAKRTKTFAGMYLHVQPHNPQALADFFENLTKVMQ